MFICFGLVIPHFHELIVLIYIIDYITLFFTVCKLVTKEISEKLDKTHSSDVIETGYNIDSTKKKTKYNLS